MAQELAVWCLQTGFPPDTYNQLTRLERSQFYKIARAAVKRSG